MARAVKAVGHIPPPAASANAGETATATVRINPAADPFKRLGLYGLGVIAPVLVAALATEEPLLLIGPHGTAKS